MNRTALLATVTLALVLAAGGLLACNGPSVEFIASDASYTSSQTRLILERTDVSRFADEPTERAPRLRSSALADLRSQGEVEAEAADLITETFPPDTRSVPVYVERATVDGTPSYVIIEAWGPSTGTLERKRLWVIDSDTGDVVYSAAAR